MKKQIHPAVVGVTIVLLLAIVGFLFYKAAGGPGKLPYGAVGNAGPFAPGGVANSSQNGANAGGAKLKGSPTPKTN